MNESAQTILISKPNDWAGIIKAQQQLIRTGQYVRIGRLDVLCFEYTANSNPKMKVLGQQRNAQGRPAWPGIHLDWLNQGPEVALTEAGVLLPSYPFPLPPPSPDPTWIYSEATPSPKLVPQLITDRAMRIKGTNFLIIQPVVELNWVLETAQPGHARREKHLVGPDFDGLHMAFIYDPDAQTGHLVGGRVL
jgi:hypothetical protein